MHLTLDQVRHVAKLARLALTADEEVLFAQQLSAILEAVDALTHLDTAGVTPASHQGDGAPLVRSDEPHGLLSTDQVLANAPQAVGTSFAIPRVIE
jgi:aspartyl-tRNA(Asn)/glutamyl-tRNA(Gln) amidotransferase subunit C